MSLELMKLHQAVPAQETISKLHLDSSYFLSFSWDSESLFLGRNRVVFVIGINWINCDIINCLSSPIVKTDGDNSSFVCGMSNHTEYYQNNVQNIKFDTIIISKGIKCDIYCIWKINVIKIVLRRRFTKLSPVGQSQFNPTWLTLVLISLYDPTPTPRKLS